MSCLFGLALAFSATLQLSSAPRAQEARPSSAAPQAASQPKIAAASPSRQELTAADLGAFLDGLVPMQLQREDIAGAVIAVVKDGQLLFPDPAPPEATLTSAARDAKTVTGLYLNSRRSETTILSIISAFEQLKVSANSDGTISADALRSYSGQAKHLREVGPLLFRDVNGSDRVAFTRDASGHLVLATDFPFFVFQRVPWYRSTYLNSGVFYGSLGVFGLALLFWPFGAGIRWHYGRKLDLSMPQRRMRLWTRLVCLINLAFLMAWIAYGSLAEKNLSLLSDSFDPWMRLMELLGFIGVLGTVVALYNCVKAWGNPDRWLWSKVGETLVALACLGLTWFVFQWHMLALSLNY